MKATILGAFALTLLLPGLAPAATLLSNLTESPPETHGLIIEISRYAGAVGFRTPDHAYYTLDQVTLSVWPWSDTTTFAAQVELRGNTESNTPAGTAIFTFPRTEYPPTDGPYRYVVAASPGPVLQPGTTYWLVVRTDESILEHGFDWEGEFTSGNLDIVTPTGLATCMGYRFGSLAPTASWANTVYNPGVMLEGTPVPQLSVLRSDSGLNIRWSAPPTNFVLEAASTFGTSAQWTPVKSVVAGVEGSYSVELDDASTRQFFRLRRP